MIQLPSLIPPFRYAMIEEYLFRGGYPKPRNLRFLKRLRLKTILSLIPSPLKPEVQEFCKQHNIILIHIQVDKMKEDNIPLSYNKTLMALQILIDPANHPLYLHCLDGADVTGLIVACLRKLQMWSTSSAMSEFSRYLHTNVISPEEFEFVENFKNFEVIIPSILPPWLWGGQVSFRKHSCLRLKFLNPEMMTEEEREIKARKEKLEKEKEDDYQRRKNDLLDNLLDTTGDGRHHRSSSHNNDDNADIDQDISSLSSNKPPSLAGSDDIGFVPSSRLNSFTGRRESKDTGSPSKDRYLVDVDVDVDRVMMDGLDQVEYYNRYGHHYRINDDDDDENERDRDSSGSLMLDEETEEIEVISRTLDALALEGL